MTRMVRVASETTDIVGSLVFVNSVLPSKEGSHVACQSL